MSRMYFNHLGGRSRGSLVVCCGLIAFVSGFFSAGANAEYKIRYPNIDYREVEIEHNYSTTFDKRNDKNRRSTSPTEIGLGILPFWFIEIEGEFAREPGEGWKFEATTLESYFMLTEPGKYWMDFAIFTEYSRAKNRADSDIAEIGFLFQKQIEKTIHTLNLYWEKPVGARAEPVDTFKYAWQSRYMLNRYFQPGIEIYGQVDDVNKSGKPDERQLRLGPMFAGSAPLNDILGRGKLKYEAGYLFGTTTATERGTLRTRLEIEFPF